MKNSAQSDWPQPAEGPAIKYAAGILLMTRQSPNQFLLMRHTDRWDLPKGHSEPGESVIETALRETEEETGIAASKIDIDPDFRFELRYPVRYKKRDATPFQKHVVFLLGQVETAQSLVLTEHVSYRWFHWQPPHSIQEQTIDPLLSAVEVHLADE